ncbi:hypothetical protein ACN28E_01475 [Archangium lansingense]|uniref:hypothetical protein n=1 Tax=Archangium lansingense TaxID=2995310 RepID=UPI003B80FDE7
MAPSISYPHPVLGNADDVGSGKIEPEVSFTASEELVEIILDKLRTGNETLDTMLGDGRATWSIRVQCARTYFRAEYQTSNSAHRVRLAGHELEGRVEIEVMLFATVPLSAYLPAGAHQDYGGDTFDLKVGEVLGIGPTFTFNVDKQWDPLKAPVASIMRISKGEHPKGPFIVALEDNYIELLLSHEDWDQYAGVKERVPGIIHSALVLPALAEAVPRISEYAGKIWADRLRAISEHRGIDTTKPLQAAQILLQDPLARTFREINTELDRDS